MIVRTIEMLLEYASIILCIYKAAGERIKFNCWLPSIFIIEWFMIIFLDNKTIAGLGKIIVYIVLVFYIKYKVTQNWEKAIKVYGSVIVTIVILQIILYLLLTFLIPNIQYSGIYINLFSCIIILFGKEKIDKMISTKLRNIKGLLFIILIYSLSFFRIFWIFCQNGYVNEEESIRFSLETVVLSILLILWFSAENSNKHKMKEIKMYEMYTQAFEETITTIRVRQHEFENHINAIKCMRYTIENQEELLIAQEKYCEDVLKESKIGNLLKLRMEPALIGFLYAKITTAEEVGIHIEYEVNPIDIRGRIQVYEIIELIGVLFDNAIEALQEKKNKKLILKLVNTDRGFMIEIANISRVYMNNEIENFWTYGYSTKGENRGIGLVRAKEIVKKTNAILSIQNQIYEDENYLCFNIRFDN